MPLVSAIMTGYIVAIGWLYVSSPVARSERIRPPARLVFLFYGLLPVTPLLWLAAVRPESRRRSTADQQADEAPTALRPIR